MKTMHKLGLVITAVGGISGGAIAAAADKPSGAPPTTAHRHEGGGTGSKELHQHMMKASAEMKSMRMTGDVDRDFVTAMKQHHQDGIEMAKIVLQHGTDPKAKEIAQRIVDGQKKELAELDRWLTQRPAEKARPTDTGR